MGRCKELAVGRPNGVGAVDRPLVLIVKQVIANCKLKNANCKIKSLLCRVRAHETVNPEQYQLPTDDCPLTTTQFAICILHFSLCNLYFNHSSRLNRDASNQRLENDCRLAHPNGRMALVLAATTERYGIAAGFGRENAIGSYRRLTTIRSNQVPFCLQTPVFECSALLGLQLAHSRDRSHCKLQN